MRDLFNEIKKISPFSKNVFQLGISLMIGYYIIALLANILRPYAENPLELSAVMNGCLEAAPAVLVVTVVAGLLCDIIIKKDIQK